MSDVTTELETEYRLVEEQVREQHHELFDQLELELLEKWAAIWAETGFDVEKVRVRVTPRIRVEVAESKTEDAPDEP